MADSQQLKGTVDRFLFQNSHNGYAVLYLLLENETSVVACGYLPNVQAGQEVVLQGTWIVHPKFGKQFDVAQCVTQVPTSVVGLKKYLGSGLIKGIGPVYAEKLVSHFGATVLEVIDSDPLRLHEVPGIGHKRIEQIINAWRDQKEISNVMIYLQEKGISPAYAAKIYKQYGQNAIAVITENPYRLADDIWGVGFKMADQLAKAIGISNESLKRIKAGLLFTIANNVGQGHLYVELDALKEQTIALLAIENNTDSLLKNALHDLYNEQRITLISHLDNHYITLKHYYLSEKGIAQKLQKLLSYQSLHSLDIGAIYQTLRSESTQEIMLNDDQQRAIIACLQNKVTIITGGPGTGKTTVIKKLLQILDGNKLSYRLAAPTGRAAKRITQSTGKIALTIHRLLEFDVATRGFSRNEQNALQLDFLIVDEASMIDVFLAHSLLKALPFNAHLVLIGDIDQLPSVGAGNFLNDLIASTKVTTIRLTEIFRQAQNSLIILNAHRVNNGEFPLSFLPEAKRDFVFIKEYDPHNLHHHLNEILLKKLPGWNISTHDCMILVPMNRGIVGTQQLNSYLQPILNKTADQKQLMHGIYRYTIGDRVMQIRNNYDKIVFNGDVGTITDINISDKIIFVQFYERVVEYEQSELDELVLAYAISIHKSQGSEYPAVIIPIFMQHFTLLQRNLLYTAITRAKKLCILIGQPRAIGMAVKNNKSLERITFLTQFLVNNLEAR